MLAWGQFLSSSLPLRPLCLTVRVQYIGDAIYAQWPKVKFMANAKNTHIPGSNKARNIGVSTRYVRGQMAESQQYESMLERDFLMLLRIDRTVESFLCQHIQIPYTLFGQARTYTPDVLVKYKPDHDGVVKQTTLFEVKPEEYADHPDDELAAKLAAANLFCPEQGWRFEVVSEPDIRIPKLKNAEFFLRYLDRKGDPDQKKALLKQLQRMGDTTSRSLLDSVARTPQSQAAWSPDLWTLIAQGHIGVDWDEPFSMSSEIWEIDQ